MITSLREGKAKLSALVERAAQGEEIVITVRGKPRARLCPMPSRAPPSAGERGRWLRQLREARAVYAAGPPQSGAALLDALREDRA